MAEPFDTNNDAISALRAQRRSAQDAEIALRGQGNDNDADSIWEKSQILTTKIDILIGRLMDQWTQQAGALTDKLTGAQAGLDAAVQKIKDNQQVAQQVTAVLGALDQAIGIAAKFLA